MKMENYHEAVSNSISILALGPVDPTLFNGCSTSLHRVKALQSCYGLVHTIDSSTQLLNFSARLKNRISNNLYRRGIPVAFPDVRKNNRRLIEAAQEKDWNLLWLEKPLTVHSKTLVTLKQLCPKAPIVGFSCDDMNVRHNQSVQFLKALPCYDYFITTKSYNVDELKALGCPNVIFMGNGYDPATFRPLSPSPVEKVRLGGDVGFVGAYEAERFESMLYLATQGIQVHVWGWGREWQSCKDAHPNLIIEGVPLWGDDYVKACCSFKVNLAFLRKINRDQQTTRSVEIPACGAFMLGERTEEHQALFREGAEAAFFSSNEELLEKCQYYLAHDQERYDIARAGRERCLKDGYSNAERIRPVVDRILEDYTMSS